MNEIDEPACASRPERLNDPMIASRQPIRRTKAIGPCPNRWTSPNIFCLQCGDSYSIPSNDMSPRRPLLTGEPLPLPPFAVLSRSQHRDGRQMAFPALFGNESDGSPGRSTSAINLDG